MAPGAPLLDVLKALQRAFYVDGLDTTGPATLARVTADALTAARHRTDAEALLEKYQSASTIEATRDDFATARRWGISSFPALLMAMNDELRLVVPGYASASEIRSGLQSLRDRVVEGAQVQ